MSLLRKLERGHDRRHQFGDRFIAGHAVRKAGHLIRDRHVDLGVIRTGNGVADQSHCLIDFFFDGDRQAIDLDRLALRRLGVNAAELFGMPDIDGGLIGGASLQANEFLTIGRAANA